MNKKEVLKLAKGFRGRAKNCIRIARERVEKALQYSYRDRRNKAGYAFPLDPAYQRRHSPPWIRPVIACCLEFAMSLRLMLKQKRLILSCNPHLHDSFKALVDISRNAFPGNKTGIPPKKEGLAILV
ncbi:UNVERIFIED_CONTAM: 50S ribosomal protein L20 [Sesamum calycinum]|uniref:Large ribosomal subunit protein bL20c n=1 Tax=Sesamum calycinum TaxID=2727403 RepID=A0AAW2J7W1_9LAMI